MVWEQRWHPLRREWVVVSSHRNERPWQGERVGDQLRALPQYVPDCYLCPGNVRSSGRRNDRYSGIFVFDNDHPCVGPDAPMQLAAPPGIYRNATAAGCARVVCFTPRHDLTLAQLPAAELLRLLEVLQQQYRELGSRDDVRHVLVFENKGEVVGVSNPHPHCQIYATNFVFKTIELEAEAQAAHLAEHGRPLLQDIVAAEEADGRRLLVRRDQAAGGRGRALHAGRLRWRTPGICSSPSWRCTSAPATRWSTRARGRPRSASPPWLATSRRGATRSTPLIAWARKPSCRASPTSPARSRCAW